MQWLPINAGFRNIGQQLHQPGTASPGLTKYYDALLSLELFEIKDPFKDNVNMESFNSVYPVQKPGRCICSFPYHYVIKNIKFALQ